LVKNIEVSVDVKGIKSVQIENDNGELNSEKSYYPFTAQPIKGSNFYIKYPEMFSKNGKRQTLPSIGKTPNFHKRFIQRVYHGTGSKYQSE
jgi:hypothetical protein